jgi:hypothetical protein
MMGKRRGPTPKVGWDPMTRRTALVDHHKAVAALAAVGADPPDEIWGNRLYSAVARYARVDGKRQPRTDLLWISLHRRDRKPIHDWRHFQAIKNEIAGPDRTAVEVYPAEANLVDTSNEYHLWVLPAGFELPFGFASGRLVMTPEMVEASNDADDLKAVQRAWEPGIPTGRGNG